MHARHALSGAAVPTVPGTKPARPVQRHSAVTETNDEDEDDSDEDYTPE